MKKNLFILALLCTVAVLALMLWFKQDLKEDPITLPKPIPSQIDKTKPSTSVEDEKKTTAPVAKKNDGVLIETAVTFSFASDAKKGEEGN